MLQNPKKIFYFACSHWDREWFKPFQVFRFRLVDIINEICDVMESDQAFKVFHLDGQTLLLEDFINIEPLKKDRLSSLLKENRLKAGPWYTMPDEFLTSGESLITNLILGMRISKDLGIETWKYGFLCDIFGHIAQMPQILNGFNIYGALVGRGTNYHNCPSHFLWQSPDNSSCITFKVPEEVGYGTFWYDVLADYVTGIDDSWDNLINRSRNYIDNELQRSDIPYVVLMDSMDHERIHHIAPKLCEELAKIYDCPVEIDDLSKIVDEIKPYYSTLPIKAGELIETAKANVIHNMLITNTLSSRFDIKKSNDICQSLLEKWANPIVAVVSIKNKIIPKTFIDTAYKYLIKNHAHDSICGCSIDEVHQDMAYRFRQTEQIAKTATEYGLSDIVGLKKKTSAPVSKVINETDGTKRVVIFNPLPFERNEVVTVDIDFEKDYSFKYNEPSGIERINSFKLIDYSGKERPYSLNNITTNAYHAEYTGYYSIEVDLYNISFETKLPAFGYSEYKLVPCNHPVRYLDEISNNEWSAENEYISLKINKDGTINITDKLTNTSYNNLLSFIDDGEVGDGWFHRKPIRDRAVTSRGNRIIIEKISDGPCSCEFEITTIMSVPDSLCIAKNGIHRNSIFKDLKISIAIIFTKTNPWVDVKITVYNTVKDHRLRMRIPTGITTDFYEADQAFCFVNRKTGFDRTTGEWKESDLAEKAFSSIALKRDDTKGFAIMSAYGVHEMAALDDKDGTLIFTLFRSFEKTFLTTGQPDGQLNMPLEYSFRFLPLNNDIKNSDLIKIKDCLQTGIRCVTEPVMKSFEPKLQNALFELKSDNIVLSVIKTPENGKKNSIVARFVNYSHKQAFAQFVCNDDISEAVECTLNENIIATADFKCNTLNIAAEPHKVKTFIITF